MEFKSAGVKVTITLEVTTGSVYGPEWTIGDLRKQVARESVQMITNKLAGSLLNIVGDPVVTVVNITEKK